ncbi:MAG: NAD-dependent deacetylase [Verrucomicrobiia bacterium]
MGVDSGLPDFRGRQGFWRAYPFLAKLGLSFEEMANPTWFDRDPRLAWAFYGHRLDLYRRTKPHAGFRHLLELASQKSHGYFVFTSNVDGQFQKAGFAPARVVECHGSIHHLQCSRGCCGEIWDADGEEVQIDDGSFRALEPLPKCGHCSAVARPNILMFGDWLWSGQRTARQQGLFEEWMDGLRRISAKLAILEVGAGTAVATVRYTSERVANRLGGRLIRINPRESAAPDGHIALPMGALDGIGRLIAGTGTE